VKADPAGDGTIATVPEAGDYAFLWAWEPLRPKAVAGLLAGFAKPWWICGGWALDLFLDRETRSHDDLDVAILRCDQPDLYRYLEGWHLRYATPEHTLERWNGRRLAPPIHGIWARRSGNPLAPWTCEFLLNESACDEWVFREDNAVTRPLEEIGAKSDGIPFLRPEIVLLYKATERTPKNDVDFAAVRPRLAREDRLWLCEALETRETDHPWIPPLRLAEDEPRG
jgi:Aminoglycoside-2''-adenylyltransferase